MLSKSKNISTPRLLITMEGFNQDYAWAEAMESVIQTAKSNITQFKSLISLLNFLSTEYQAYKIGNPFKATKQSNQYYLNSDTPEFGQYRTTILTTIIKDRYLTYLPQVKQLLKKCNLHQSAYYIDEMEIPLTITHHYKDYYQWVHTSPSLFPIVFNAMNTIYLDLQWLKKQKQTSSIRKLELDNVAKLHWLLIQTMPYKRGTAGISDILTKVLLDDVDIIMSPWKSGLAPDLEALTLPIHEFINRYSNFVQ